MRRRWPSASTSATRGPAAPTRRRASPRRSSTSTPTSGTVSGCGPCSWSADEATAEAVAPPHPPDRPGGGLLGRDRELRLLRAWLDATRQGEGRLVLLAGEPGIGKTRL